LPFNFALETLAMRGASGIAVAGASDLLHIWLEELRKEGLSFQSSGQSNEVLSEAEYSESIYKGFTDGLCEASAIFCNRREAEAVQAEFEEKQRNNPKNWSPLRQNFEAFKEITKLVTGPRETIPEVLVRDVLARQYDVKPEKVTWQQIRMALADLGRDYPAITLVRSGPAPSQRVPESTSLPDSTSGEIDRRAKFLADYKATTKPPVLADIRERFLRDAAILRIESREGVCDRLTHNSDQNGALNHPYKVASAGFTEWMEDLGKFAAGHVMTLARMAHAHSEWGVADPVEWARIQVAEFVDDELYPKRCRKCGKSRSDHSGTDHEFSKAMSRIELWWRMVSGEEEDFDLHDYGRPERWLAPVWIRKDPEKTEDFLRALHFNFDERLKWVLHDAEGDARIKLCLVSVNSESVAELAPGAPNTQPLRLANGNSKLPAQPAKTDSDAWIRRADELLAKHPSANYHRASELYQFATSLLSTLYGVESPEMQSLRSNAELASKDKSAFQAGHISLLAQGAIKAARDDLKAGLTGNLKSASEIVPLSTREGAVTGALLSNYRSEIKRAILTQLALKPKATDGEICRGLDADGSVELPSSWKSKTSDRGFFDAYSDAVRRHKVEVTISKVRKDLRKQGLLE
jgi:hypothetical protein